MKLTDAEKNILLWAIKHARASLPLDPEDPYAHLMTHELLDSCQSEVEALVPDNRKYLEET